MSSTTWRKRNAKVIQDLRELCKAYKVRYRIVPSLTYEGYADLRKEIIYLKPVDNPSHFLSTACHEICHILAAREGKFKVYHSWIVDTKDPVYIRAFLRTGWRAEQYVDRQGRILLKKHFPSLRYKLGYTKADKKWHDYHNMEWWRSRLHEHQRTNQC